MGCFYPCLNSLGFQHHSILRLQFHYTIISKVLEVSRSSGLYMNLCQEDLFLSTHLSTNLLFLDKNQVLRSKWIQKFPQVPNVFCSKIDPQNKLKMILLFLGELSIAGVLQGISSFSIQRGVFIVWKKIRRSTSSGRQEKSETVELLFVNRKNGNWRSSINYVRITRGREGSENFYMILPQGEGVKDIFKRNRLL